MPAIKWPLFTRRGALALSATFSFGSLSNEPSVRFQYKNTELNSNAKLEVINSIPVLQIKGGPTEIGHATGKLALRQASGILSYPKSLITLFRLDPIWPILVNLGNRMADRFPEGLKQEMNAIQMASGVDKNSLVAGNTMFDLKGMVFCSGIAINSTRSDTGGTLLGRNLDYPPVGDIGQYSLVTVLRQPGLRSFASVGFPGVLGVLSGINDAGLALAIHEVVDVRPPQRKFNPQGWPYAICYRKVLENCTSIHEAIQYLNKLPRASATNLLIADKSDVAILEITPDQVKCLPSVQGTAHCTNHFRHPDNLPDDPANPFQSRERLECLMNRCNSKTIMGIKAVQQALHETNLGQNTLQSMIFDTKALRLHLAYGKPPSTNGPYSSIELGPLLRS